MPHLFPVLVNSSAPAVAVVQIIAAIDAAQPAVRAIAAAFGVRHETARWLLRQRLPQQWAMNAERLQLILTLVSWIVPEKRPANEIEFQSMLETAKTLATILRPFRDAPLASNTLPELRFHALLRNWMAELAYPDCSALQSNLSRLERSAGGIAGLADFLASLYRARIRDLAGAMDDAGAVQAVEAAVLAWAEKRPFTQLMRDSAQWHQHLSLSSDQPHARDSDDSRHQPLTSMDHWPSVLARPYRHEQLTIIELANAAHLAEEGMTLQHCVGSYWRHCLSENSLIFSVRNNQSQPLSTVELHLDHASLQVIKGQHCGVQNARPATSCVAAVDTLVRKLNCLTNQDALAERARFQQAQGRLKRMGLYRSADAAHAAEFAMDEFARRISESAGALCRQGITPA